MASAGMSQNNSAAHRKLMAEMAEAAKSRRAKKGRGNGKRYIYNGVKPINVNVPATVDMDTVNASNQV